jgi:hypothetical protein
VSRLGLPAELRRSLACTDVIENMMGTVRRVTRNVKRWSSSSMALRWTAAAMNEAKKGFRRLKAYKQLPALRVALAAHYERESLLSKLRRPLSIIHGNDRFTKCNRARGNSYQQASQLEGLLLMPQFECPKSTTSSASKKFLRLKRWAD